MGRRILLGFILICAIAFGAPAGFLCMRDLLDSNYSAPTEAWNLTKGFLLLLAGQGIRHVLSERKRKEPPKHVGGT